MSRRKKEVPEAPEESLLLPAAAKRRKKLCWYWIVKKTGEIPVETPTRSWIPRWFNEKDEYNSKKYEKLRDCLQGLFVEIGSNKPRGLTNILLSNRTALISVIGPGGESSPVYQFEVRFKNEYGKPSEWSVRDPLTKKPFAVDDFILENFCFDGD